jgi:hypothetical protein
VGICTVELADIWVEEAAAAAEEGEEDAGADREEGHGAGDEVDEMDGEKRASRSMSTEPRPTTHRRGTPQRERPNRSATCSSTRLWFNPNRHALA